MVAYQDLPANARVWIYQSNRLLTVTESEQARQALRQFVEQWQSHGKPVRAWSEVLHQLFLVLVVDEDYEAPSGCSIDASVALIRELGQALDVDWFDRMVFAYQTIDQQVHTAQESNLLNCMPMGLLLMKRPSLITWSIPNKNLKLLGVFH